MVSLFLSCLPLCSSAEDNHKGPEREWHAWAWGWIPTCSVAVRTHLRTVDVYQSCDIKCKSYCQHWDIVIITLKWMMIDFDWTALVSGWWGGLTVPVRACLAWCLLNLNRGLCVAQKIQFHMYQSLFIKTYFTWLLVAESKWKGYECVIASTYKL